MFKTIKKTAAVVVVTVSTAITAPAFAEGQASGTGGASEIFSAVDLSGIVGFVTTAGVTIVGIALAMKGISLAKRALSKA